MAEALYTTAGRAADSAVAARTETYDLIKEINRELSDVPELVSTRRAQAQAVDRLLSSAEHDGFEVQSHRDRFTAIQAELDRQAQAATVAQRFDLFPVIDALASVERQMGQVTHAVQSLKRQRSDAVEGIAQLQAELRDIRRLQADAVTAFKRVQANYCRQCWQKYEHDGSVADSYIATVTGQIDDIRELAGMKQQQWAQVSPALAQAAARLQDARALLEGWVSLESGLEEACTTLTEQAAAVRAQLEHVALTIHTNRSDVSSETDQSLAVAWGYLRDADDTLAADQPDYPRAQKLLRKARRAGRIADGTLQQQLNQAATSRAKAQEAMRAARAQIIETETFMSYHFHGMPVMSRPVVERARRELQSAREADQPSEQVRLANEAKDSAKAALEEAREQLQSVPFGMNGPMAY
jgi:predicted  nucleic acid-binding Zn-ribbon protein